MNSKLQYRERTPESVDRHLARHERQNAEIENLRAAYRNNASALCIALRAEGHDNLADLLSKARWAKRIAKSSPINWRNDDEVRRHIVCIVTGQAELIRRRTGGQLPRRTWPRLVDRVINDLDHQGLLNKLGQTGQFLTDRGMPRIWWNNKQELDHLRDRVLEDVRQGVNYIRRRDPALP